MLVDMRSALPGPRTPFFVCELDDGTRLLHRVRGGFPLNFGREAVCELINKPEKGKRDFFGQKYPFFRRLEKLRGRR